MTDDTAIIQGNVKFREGKKWKPRWCVLRKLSPVADCVQLEVFTRGTGGAGGARGVFPLRPYAGFEVGLAVGGEAHALAVLSAERALLLAASGTDDLRRWTDALRDHVGDTDRFRVVVPGAGPARVLVVAGRVSLVGGAAGTPPRVLASWCLRAVRRFGAVRGRFALEAGARAGAGAGVRTLLTDRADDIARAVARAAAADRAPRRARLERCASCVSRLDGFAPAWTMDRATADVHYDVPRTALEFDGEYYDTPRRMHDYLNEESFRIPKSCTVDALSRRVDDWLRPCAEPAERSGALYATVDARRKAGRAASESRAYQNAGVLRACGDHYVPMRAAAGYAAMRPASPPRAPAPHPHGSNDSGVWSCAPIRAPATSKSVADSRSTSSGASDMSDYMETLSLSSDPSWEAQRPA